MNNAMHDMLDGLGALIFKQRCERQGVGDDVITWTTAPEYTRIRYREDAKPFFDLLLRFIDSRVVMCRQTHELDHHGITPEPDHGYRVADQNRY